MDEFTGEVLAGRLSPGVEVWEWIGGLPGPVAVLYEAGPTGFGLARELRAAGIRCEVAAPSKLQRPSGERVKTDAKDAEQLCQLLRLGAFTPVTVPDAAAESARDLVRCREDCRTDLMRARHRLSKLLLRQQVVYADGNAWTGKHLAWLARQRFDDPNLECTVEEVPGPGVGHDRAPGPARRPHRTAGRRLRVDPDGAPVELPARDLDPDRVRVGGRDRRLDPVRRQQHRRLPGPDPLRTLLRGQQAARPDHPDREQPRPPALDRSLPRTICSPTAVARCCGPGGSWHPPAARARADAGNRRLHARWVGFQARKKLHHVATVAIARELAGWCWSVATIDD